MEESRYFLSAILLGIIIGMLVPFIVIAILSGCSSPQPIKCTYTCPPGARPPIGCYCLEDEINKEADLILKKGK